MAHIPMDDIDTLWNGTSEHRWGALRETLKEHKGKTDGISDKLVDMMLSAVNDLEESNKPYPETSKELSDILNDSVADMDEEVI